MFQIILIDPNIGAELNPFKINFITSTAPPPVGGGDMFIIWIWDDNDLMI